MNSKGIISYCKRLRIFPDKSMWEVCTAPAKNGREMCYCLCLREHNCIKEEPYKQIKKTKGEVKSAYNKKIIVWYYLESVSKIGASVDDISNRLTANTSHTIACGKY